MHMSGEFYDVDGFLAGRSTLRPFEVAEMPLLYSIKTIRPRAVG